MTVQFISFVKYEISSWKYGHSTLNTYVGSFLNSSPWILKNALDPRNPASSASNERKISLVWCNWAKLFVFLSSEKYFANSIPVVTETRLSPAPGVPIGFKKFRIGRRYLIKNVKISRI